MFKQVVAGGTDASEDTWVEEVYIFIAGAWHKRRAGPHKGH